MTGPESGAGSPPVSLREPLLTWFVAIAMASALFWTARFLPAMRDFLHAGIAVVFLYGPSAAAALSGRPFDHRAAGLRLGPLRRNALTLLQVLLITWPPFLLAFLAFYSWTCPRAAAGGVLSLLVEYLAPVCGGWQGLAGATLRWPPQFPLLIASQVLAIALPEELFFRGYLMGRLEERWPSRRSFAGAAVGWPLLVSSALFALGHVLVDFAPGRLAVFFPSLVFGWMRARTGSLAAPIAFHALCNLLSEVLFYSFFAFETRS